MVAISLYRGNLHRVPDAPRQWVMPRRSISLKQFRSLLRRRSKALSVLTGTDQSAITTTVPLPPPPPPPPLPPPPRVLPQPSSPSPPAPIPPEKQKQGEGNTNIPSEEAENRCPEDEKLKDPKESGGDDCVAEKLKNSIVLYEGETDADVGKVKGPDAVREHSHGGKLKDSQAERGKQEGENRDGQGNNNVKTGDEKEKRQKEIVEELEVLNKKKHNLVQLLKQILNAEEELKRRSSNHVPPRPSLSLQVDVTKDSGSLTRQPTPRLGSDMNVAEVKGEAEDYSNPVIQPRQSLRLSSTSPSAESALRRAPHFQHQVSVSLPSRSSAFAAGSPSRFAPLASQSSAPPPTMQTVSVSGTSYAASSPSPAASGGTSSFRDTRHPSPWN